MVNGGGVTTGFSIKEEEEDVMIESPQVEGMKRGGHKDCESHTGEGNKPHQQKKGLGGAKERYFVSPPPPGVHQVMLSCSVAFGGNLPPTSVRKYQLLKNVVRDLQAVTPEDVGLPQDPMQLREGGPRHVSVYAGQLMSFEILVLLDETKPLVLEIGDEVIAVCRCLVGAAKVRLYTRADAATEPKYTGEARNRKPVAAQSSDEHGAEGADKKNVRVRLVEEDGGLWSAQTEAKDMGERVFFSIETAQSTKKEAGCEQRAGACAFLLVTSSCRGEHRKKIFYDLQAGEGAAGAGVTQAGFVELQQTEAHEIFQTSTPYAGQFWGPLAMGLRIISSHVDLPKKNSEEEEEEEDDDDEPSEVKPRRKHARR